MRLLLAENDYPLALFVSKRLEKEDFIVDVAADGAEVRMLAGRNDYQLLIIDMNLPKSSGASVLSDVRANKEDLPILVLSDPLKVEERVRVLDLGADDCLFKPFSFVELAARIRTLLRRAGRGLKPVLTVADLQLNRLEHSVQRAGRKIELTPKEFLLLECLMQGAGHPVSRAQILGRVWNFSTGSLTNVVNVYVNYLRKKVDEPFQSQLIRTIRGVGYQIGGKEAASGLPPSMAGALVNAAANGR